MQNNGTDKNSHQNGASVATDNVVSFPSNDQTRLNDISTLLQGAPVIQSKAPAKSSRNASPAGSEIASAEDFAQLEEKKPFARKIGPKTIAAAGLAAVFVLPLSWAFMSGKSSHKSENTQTAEVSEASAEEDSNISPEEYAAQQAELEHYRSQQAFIDQQVDADAIDDAGRQKKQSATTQATARPTRDSSTTASRPVPATTIASPTSVTVRPAPAPSRAAPIQRATPVAARSTSMAAPRSSAPVAQRPNAQSSAREPEPIDPFERRAQLQALGSYGAPPPTAQAARAVSYEQAANPFETENPYVQAISLEPPQAKPAVSTSTQEVAPAKKPLTEAELQYQQDADAVLAAAPPTEAPEGNSPEAQEDVAAVLEPDEPDATEATEQPAATPMAIMPGTNTEAKLPYGFSWQEGTALPEVLLLTTEDIMAGERAVIPAGTQFLGQAAVDPGSGAVTIQVVGLFGETKDIQIPRSSIIVQAEDGSVLTAKASGGSDPRSSHSNVGGFLMESLGNGVGNVINSDDSLVGDLAGGMAETVIDRQIERSRANASARDSRTASQPIVWTLNARPVRLTFNSYIPLSSAQQ